MKYVCIDIETTGLNPDKNQILEFAAVFEDTEKELPLDKLPTMHCYLVHDSLTGDPYALDMNAAIIGKIARHRAGKPVEGNFVVPGILNYRFCQWLYDCRLNPSDAITAAGKNFSGFDRKFLEKLPGWPVKFRHRVLDPMPMFAKSTDEVPPDLATCLARAGVGGSVTHTALEDALATVACLREGFSRNARIV